MQTEKANNKLLIAVLILTLLLIITMGSADVALNNHVQSESRKDAQIDSLQSQLAWREIQWDNFTDEEQR